MQPPNFSYNLILVSFQWVSFYLKYYKSRYTIINILHHLEVLISFDRMSFFSEATSRPIFPSMNVNEDLENKVDSVENISSSSIVRKKSDIVLVTNNGRFQIVRNVMKNVKEVMLGTKLVVLFPAVPLAVAADFYSLGRVSN